MTPISNEDVKLFEDQVVPALRALGADTLANIAVLIVENLRAERAKVGELEEKIEILEPEVTELHKIIATLEQQLAEAAVGAQAILNRTDTWNFPTLGEREFLQSLARQKNQQ